MDTFLMICAVCVDFVDPRGEVFSITPKTRGTFVMAPVWIKDTLIYKMLMNDGSIKIATDEKTKKQLENDPLDGLAAEGKAVDKVVEAVDEEPEEGEAEETPKKKTRAKKGEAK